jgi:hypothetical protein
VRLDKAIPILYSTDVEGSVKYFTECLKFDNHWLWSDPPEGDVHASFAGVYRDEVEIFFCKNDQGNPGTWLSLVVDNVDEYYALIRDDGAKILSPPNTKPWNMREMLVECPDAHIIRIGHNTSCE